MPARPRVRRLLVACALPLLASCATWWNFAEIGPLVERSETVAREDAIDADVSVAFYGGELHVAPTDDDVLVELHSKDNVAELEPRMERRRDGRHLSARFFIQSQSRLPVSDDLTHKWDLALGKLVPITLDVRLAVTDAKLDLGGVPLRSARLDVGAGSADVDFSARNPVAMDELSVQSGVGNLKLHALGNSGSRRVQIDAAAGVCELDLSGEWRELATMRVEAGAATVRVLVPADLPLRVETHEPLLGEITAPGFRVEKPGTLVSPAWERGAREVVLELEASLGSVEIVTIASS